MRQLLFTIAAVVAVAVLMPAAPLVAESPTSVIEAAAGSGVFIAPGREGFDPTSLSEVIGDARRIGLSMAITAPAEPAPSAEAFALRVRQAGDFDIALVFAPDGVIQASVTDELSAREVPALDAARAAVTPEEAASAYLVTLVAERDNSLPGTVRTIVALVIICVILLIGATLAEQLLGRMSETAVPGDHVNQ